MEQLFDQRLQDPNVILNSRKTMQDFKDRRVNPFDYAIRKVVENDRSPHIARRVDGVFAMPMFLNTDRPTVKARLLRPLTEPQFLDRLRPGNQHFTFFA
jgi:hypothetical protein